MARALLSCQVKKNTLILKSKMSRIVNRANLAISPKDYLDNKRKRRVRERWGGAEKDPHKQANGSTGLMTPLARGILLANLTKAE